MALITVIVVAGGLWALWEQWRDAGRPVDLEHEEREARHGRRLAIAFGAALLALVAGLALDGLGVDAAGWIALAAVAALLVVFYVGPWLGPRRSRRR
ncbi:MAG: hypothetical protein JWQ18_3800 [Conexibacter sp.]|nr:hypothetical protein [Conexibacter sp.]